MLLLQLLVMSGRMRMLVRMVEVPLVRAGATASANKVKWWTLPWFSVWVLVR